MSILDIGIALRNVYAPALREQLAREAIYVDAGDGETLAEAVERTTGETTIFFGGRDSMIQSRHLSREIREDLHRTREVPDLIKTVELLVERVRELECGRVWKKTGKPVTRRIVNGDRDGV